MVINTVPKLLATFLNENTNYNFVALCCLVMRDCWHVYCQSLREKPAHTAPIFKCKHGKQGGRARQLMTTGNNKIEINKQYFTA